jgi:hypothetical protein
MVANSTCSALPGVVMFKSTGEPQKEGPGGMAALSTSRVMPHWMMLMHEAEMPSPQTHWKADKGGALISEATSYPGLSPSMAGSPNLRVSEHAPVPGVPST